MKSKLKEKNLVGFSIRLMELRAKSLAWPFITTEDSLYGLNLFLTKGDHGVVYILTLERVSELLASA